MTNETIVAVYDSAAHADAAIRDLRAANIAENAITRHSPASFGTGAATAGAPSGTLGTVAESGAEPVRREPSFWQSLFGGESDYDASVYDRSMEAGSHVITVKAPEAEVTEVIDILERHNPVDIDERAASYGLSAGSAYDTTGGPVASTAPYEDTARETGTGLRGDEERLQLAEEQIQVGKRLVNRGTTRIRCYVVETPVEENVTLHSEHVTVERRPITGDAPTADANFTDRTIEVTESEEEAVVGKTARVREEVVVRRDTAERVETVRDTVRREDVEITKEGATVDPTR